MMAKTLAAGLAWLAVWGALLAVLDQSREDAQRAAGWTASLAMQFMLTSVITAGFELCSGWRASVSRSRFTILSLFIWTTLIACLLAEGRWLSARFGWSTENFFAWDFFPHIQVNAVTNATLAIAILACVRLGKGWVLRTVASFLVLALVAPLSVALMWAIFRHNLGAPVLDLARMVVIQGAFLIATLLPLEAANEQR